MEIDLRRLKDDKYRHEVLEGLIRNYQHIILRYCVTWLGNTEGDEVAQEVFVAAWEGLLNYRQESCVRTWLFGIAKNKCAQVLRNYRRRSRIADAFVDDIRREAHATAPRNPESLAVERDRHAHLIECLDRLRTDERILLVLRYTRGLPVADIAQMVGKSEAAVRKRLLRALQKLKGLMDDGTGV